MSSYINQFYEIKTTYDAALDTLSDIGFYGIERVVAYLLKFSPQIQFDDVFIVGGLSFTYNFFAKKKLIQAVPSLSGEIGKIGFMSGGLILYEFIEAQIRGSKLSPNYLELFLAVAISQLSKFIILRKSN